MTEKKKKTRQKVDSTYGGGLTDEERKRRADQKKEDEKNNVMFNEKLIDHIFADKFKKKKEEDAKKGRDALAHYVGSKEIADRILNQKPQNKNDISYIILDKFLRGLKEVLLNYFRKKSSSNSSKKKKD